MASTSTGMHPTYTTHSHVSSYFPTLILNNTTNNNNNNNTITNATTNSGSINNMTTTILPITTNSNSNNMNTFPTGNINNINNTTSCNSMNYMNGSLNTTVTTHTPLLHLTLNTNISPTTNTNNNSNSNSPSSSSTLSNAAATTTTRIPQVYPFSLLLRDKNVDIIAIEGNKISSTLEDLQRKKYAGFKKHHYVVYYHQLDDLFNLTDHEKRGTIFKASIDDRGMKYCGVIFDKCDAHTDRKKVITPSKRGRIEIIQHDYECLYFILVRVQLGKKGNKNNDSVANTLIGPVIYYFNDPADENVTWQLERFYDDYAYSLSFSVHLSGRFRLYAFGRLKNKQTIMDVAYGEINTPNPTRSGDNEVRNLTETYQPTADHRVYIVDALSLPKNNIITATNRTTTRKRKLSHQDSGNGMDYEVKKIPKSINLAAFRNDIKPFSPDSMMSPLSTSIAALNAMNTINPLVTLSTLSTLPIIPSPTNPNNTVIPSPDYQPSSPPFIKKEDTTSHTEANLEHIMNRAYAWFNIPKKKMAV